MDFVPGRLDGRLLFWEGLPVVRPRGFIPGLMFDAGLVSKDYLLQREDHMVRQLSTQVRDTLVSDRRMMMSALAADRQTLGAGLMERIDQLKAENLKLQTSLNERWSNVMEAKR